MILEGKVWRYEDNVDTDVIIPARYLNIVDMKELANHAMEDIDKSFAKGVQPGDIIVAGKNFGCGSSREHAPAVIKESGITCVVAESFARIFYRNAINIGLPLIETGQNISKEIKTGDILKVDVLEGTVENETGSVKISTEPLPGFIEEIAKKGGLVQYTKELIKNK
ncbi:3-isopropylmalate dehydratase small subunit [Selenomonadales bacterium OttesenSCG-928-I06]|nr:3-isopropylmalate dehydratase small subunit [Selenomonadales bacterium OttesenSCG-928-I06]